MRLRAAPAAERARRHNQNWIPSQLRPVLLLLVLTASVWYTLVSFLFPGYRPAHSSSHDGGHGSVQDAVAPKRVWYTRHVHLREALLKRGSRRVYVLHLGDANRFARLAEEQGEVVAVTDGCSTGPLASDLLGASPRGQCRALRGRPHSVVVNAYGLPPEPYLDEKALYVAFLPEPGSFPPAHYCPDAGGSALSGFLRSWLPPWGSGRRAPRAPFLGALSGLPASTGVDARVAQSKAALARFDAVFTADEWVPDTATALAELLGWDPGRIPQAGWTAADAGLVPEGRRRPRTAGEGERGVYDSACGLARRGREGGDKRAAAGRAAVASCEQASAGPDGGGDGGGSGNAARAGVGGGAAAAPRFRGWQLPAGHDAGGSCAFGSGGGVALCLVVRDGAPYLREWLNFHRSVGVARVYVHNDNSADGTDEVLAPYEAAGYVVRLDSVYGPLRFRVNERTAAGGWSGQREVLARCMTHALLDSACWLLNPDLDEYIVPANPSTDKTIGGVLSAYNESMCVTVRRHAFNSNNASAVSPGAAGIVRVFLRRHAPFPPVIMELPRNPKWALNVPFAARELAAGGRHAVVPQVHNLWDRRNCSMCFRGDPEFTPEIHPCAAFYADDRYKGPGPENPRNWCTGATGASAEAVLKVHHYILPNGKSYRKKGRGDKGARRDIWEDETVDADALVFAPGADSFGPPE